MNPPAARKALQGLRLAVGVPAGLVAGTVATVAVGLANQLYLPTRVSAMCAFCAIYLGALCVFSAVTRGMGDAGTRLAGAIAAAGFAGVMFGNLWWAAAACAVVALSPATAAMATRDGRAMIFALAVTLLACALAIGCRQGLTVLLPRVMHIGWDPLFADWFFREAVFCVEMAAWAWMRGVFAGARDAEPIVDVPSV